MCKLHLCLCHLPKLRMLALVCLFKWLTKSVISRIFAHHLSLEFSSVAMACSARSMNRGPRPLGAPDAHGYNFLVKKLLPWASFGAPNGRNIENEEETKIRDSIWQSVASDERSFSKLKLIKTCLRSCMTQERTLEWFGVLKHREGEFQRNWSKCHRSWLYFIRDSISSFWFWVVQKTAR